MSDPYWTGSPKKRTPRSSKLSNISQKYIPDEELRDPPARLFRAILKKMDMNPYKWTAYLRDYLDWIITTEDPARAKVERVTKQGNIKDTYFQKYGLTFSKLLEGLSILRKRSCKITIETEDENGEIIIVSETIRIVGKDRLSKPLPDIEEPPEE